MCLEIVGVFIFLSLSKYTRYFLEALHRRSVARWKWTSTLILSFTVVSLLNPSLYRPL
jgi:hypothetical protein